MINTQGLELRWERPKYKNETLALAANLSSNLTLCLLYVEMIFKIMDLSNTFLKSEFLKYVLFESWWWQLYQFDTYYIFHFGCMLGAILTFILYQLSFESSLRIIVKPGTLERWDINQLVTVIPLDQIKWVELHRVKFSLLLNISRTRNKIYLKSQSEPMYFSLMDRRHYETLNVLLNRTNGGTN